MSFFIKAINTIISGLGAGLVAIINLLPSSPFTWDLSGIDLPTYLQIFYWAYPLQSVAAMIGVWIPCVAAYYAIRVVLRKMSVAGE